MRARLTLSDERRMARRNAVNKNSARRLQLALGELIGIQIVAPRKNP